LAAALFASTPMVQLVTGSLFVENVWGAMILGASLSLCRGEFAWAGLLLGSALSTKVGTTAYLLPAICVGLWFSWKEQRRWLPVTLGVALFAVFAAPPYLNAWLRTGNPLFPFMNNIFKSPHFETSPTAVQDVRFRKVFTWKTPFDLTFHSHEY